MAMIYVPLYLSYRRQISKLTDEQLGKLVRGLLDYASTGEEPSLEGAEAMAFSFMQDTYDRDKARYDEIAERNRINGKKGGRPKTQVVCPETQENQVVCPETQENLFNIKDNIKDKVKDKVVVIDTAAAAACPEIIPLDKNLADLAQCYEANIGAINRAVFDKMQNWLTRLPPELIAEAIGEAAENNKRRWSYAEQILRRCEQSNIRTVEAFRAEKEANRGRNITGGRQNPTDAFLEIAGGGTP